MVIFISYIILRGFFTTKRLNKLFNAMLDFYDQFDNFNFTEAQKREILDEMKVCRKEFSANNNLTVCENSLSTLIETIIKSNENARRYILSHPVLSEFEGVYEE